LKKSNGELANIAKRLEEKARALQDQNVKVSDDMHCDSHVNNQGFSENPFFNHIE